MASLAAEGAEGRRADRPGSLVQLGALPRSPGGIRGDAPESLGGHGGWSPPDRSILVCRAKSIFDADSRPGFLDFGPISAENRADCAAFSGSRGSLWPALSRQVGRKLTPGPSPEVATSRPGRARRGEKSARSGQKVCSAGLARAKVIRSGAGGRRRRSGLLAPRRSRLGPCWSTPGCASAELGPSGRASGTAMATCGGRPSARGLDRRRSGRGPPERPPPGLGLFCRDRIGP